MTAKKTTIAETFLTRAISPILRSASRKKWLRILSHFSLVRLLFFCVLFLKKKQTKINYFHPIVLDDSDDEEILTIKRKNIDLDEIPVIENNEDDKPKKKKPLTKVALAKKILKKKIVPNKRIMFDDEGQVRILLYNPLTNNTHIRSNQHMTRSNLVKLN